MLYLFHADAEITVLPDATNAWIDEGSGDLICCDNAGNEVTRYAKLAILCYSDKPFPMGSEDIRRWVLEADAASAARSYR